MSANVLATVTLLLVGTTISVSAGAQGAQGSDAGKPRLMVRLEPRYPDAARKAGITGRVTLEWTIGEHGAQDFVVIESSNPIFDDEVIKTVSVWRYFALASDGTPVRGRRVRETFVFDIEHLERYSR